MKEATYSRNTNTEELERYIREVEEKEKQRWKETLGLFLLSVISIGGLIWMLIFSQQLHTPYPDYPLTKERVIRSSNDITVSKDPKLPAVIDEDDKDEDNKGGKDAIQITEPNPVIRQDLPEWSMEIEGELEPYQKIIFHIEPFDTSFSYRINFGDGRIKSMLDSEIRYAYSRTGKYPVNISIYDRGKLVKKVGRTLYIRDE